MKVPRHLSGVMPRVDPRLVGDFAGVVRLDGRFVSGDGPPCTNGAEVTGDEWGPLEIVGAFESGDVADKGRGSGGHCEKGWFCCKRRQLNLQR